ncbi:Histone-lysine N-methyltransferase [Phytophthora megakarya]|uniref:Histone-lysine N-methyltransferase n=1 Tax=Phytophthora megakarya TaxID=4795 RepID=A0A225UQ75_9STRA|nr:Histone-lysine N-methyltransferase [Phytophthora megakarya]
MAYGHEHFIDAERAGNESTFFNYACSANCVEEEWAVVGVYRIGILAQREITAGEELAFNYGRGYNLRSCRCTTCAK